METVDGYLGRDFLCSECGKRHAVRMQHVVFADDALAQLPGLLGPHCPTRRVGLVADERTLAVAGERAAAALRAAGFGVQVVVVPDAAGSDGPVCDDHTRDWLAPRLAEPELLLAVGSGVINDLAKWVAFDSSRPYACVATAASMNGYTSANVAPLVKGVKCLQNGREAVLVAAEPEVLLAAPARMTAAGLGDVIAKPVSTADWRVNRVLLDEYYCPVCAGMIAHIEPVYMENPELIAGRSRQGMAALFEALVLTGISMTMAGTSSPASGGEHLISHTLDMMALRDGIQHDLHGRQVGVATIFCAALYERILRCDARRAAVPRPDESLEFWGRHAAEVATKLAVARQREAAVVARLHERPALWDGLCRDLAPTLPGPGRVRDVLRRGGAACSLAAIGVSRERFLEAVLHAHQMRERFTVLGLARCFGVLPDAAPELVDRWLVD